MKKEQIKDVIEVEAIETLVANTGGLPSIPKGASEAYRELHGVYERYIKQSPLQWGLEKERLLAELKAL